MVVSRCWVVGGRFCGCLHIREVVSVVLSWFRLLVGCCVHSLMVFVHQVLYLLFRSGRYYSCVEIFANVGGFGSLSVVHVSTVCYLLFYLFRTLCRDSVVLEGRWRISVVLYRFSDGLFVSS